jgi:MFS family permease
MTSIATSRRSVLAELDKRVPTSFYWSLTLLATLGGFLFGYDTANIGSALPFVPHDLSGFALGYLVAGASPGAAAGALLAGPLSGPPRPDAVRTGRPATPAPAGPCRVNA